MINLGAIMLTAYTAPSTLRQVRSLSQLVGSERTVTDARKGVPVPPGVRLVVIGDSTTVMLYKLTRAALSARPGRTEIIADTEIDLQIRDA